MMTKKRSGTLSGWKAAIAFPVILGLVMVFSTSVNTGLAKEYPNGAQIMSHSLELPVASSAIISPDQDTILKAGSKEPVYDEVKTMPSFKGGFNALVDYLIANIKYPEEAKKNHITGTVFVTFIVEKDGTVSNVTVVKGVNPLLDEAAAQSISESPKWTPGLQRGQPVRVRFVIPLNFMF